VSGLKRALLVGIDSYDRLSELTGCVNDVQALTPLLARNEDDSPNFACQSFISSTHRIDRASLLDAIDSLFAPGVDVALFYFAGHGAEAPSDVVLMAQDSDSLNTALRLSDVLARTRESSIPEIVVILDCCYSGGAGGAPQLGGDATVLRSGLSILTASRGDQPAAETADGRGLFSTYLGGALDGGAADTTGRVTLAGVYSYLSESFGPWKSRPTFKASLERLHELRRCAPAVPLADLRQLPSIFPHADTEIQLDPSFEPTAEPADPKNEATFALLQRCRAAKLVEPVGALHLYFAAMETQRCRLTPLGAHYRRLAAEGLL
jgi:uncharacterized caspase-like protein